MPTTNRKKRGKDTAVQGTNDSSAVSKVSAAALGYFQDDFLRHFVCKESRRAPLINRPLCRGPCAVAPVPWPLMLQSFCSELTHSDQQLLITGGGGRKLLLIRDAL